MTKMILSAAVFGLAVAAPAFAQDNSTSSSASQSMHRAGQDAEQSWFGYLNAAKRHNIFTFVR
jgi:hypothetical protein